MARFTPKEELDRRIAALQASLRSADVDGALIVHAADLFYFAGTIQQAHLYVPAEGVPLLMARRSFTRARQESALPDVVPLTSLRTLGGLITGQGLPLPTRLGMELDVLPARNFFHYQRLFPDAEIVDISTAIRIVRAVKSPYELAIQREAAQLMDRMVRAVPEILREGMSEVEFAGRVEAVARAGGHQGQVRLRNWNVEVFYGHILSGKNGAVPSFFDSASGGEGLSPAMPHGPGRKPIRRHEPVVVDYCAAVDGYIVDQTRLFSLGDLSERLTVAYEAMRTLQNELAEAGKPGVPAGDLYDLAMRRATEMGYADYFMGYGEGRVQFVGHGVGIELDEFPIIAHGVKMPLETGMVFAIEPKIVFPGEGLVGIENTWVVTEEGLQSLTISDENLTIL